MLQLRLLICATAFSFVVLVSSAWASSGPNPLFSTVPSLVRLVGAAGNTPDVTAGQFTVVARAPGNIPVPGASIVVDLSACPDLALCADQLDPNALVNCAAKTVRKFADAQGAVTFTLMGGSTGAGNASSLRGNARIFGNGTLMGSPSVSSFDLDGASGVGAGDLSVWLADFGSGINWARSDFDGDDTLGASDLSVWLIVFGAAGSTQSCASSCP